MSSTQAQETSPKSLSSITQAPKPPITATTHSTSTSDGDRPVKKTLTLRRTSTQSPSTPPPPSVSSTSAPPLSGNTWRDALFGRSSHSEVGSSTPIAVQTSPWPLPSSTSSRTLAHSGSPSSTLSPLPRERAVSTASSSSTIQELQPATVSSPSASARQSNTFEQSLDFPFLPPTTPKPQPDCLPPPNAEGWRIKNGQSPTLKVVSKDTTFDNCPEDVRDWANTLCVAIATYHGFFMARLRAYPHGWTRNGNSFVVDDEHITATFVRSDKANWTLHIYTSKTTTADGKVKCGVEFARWDWGFYWREEVTDGEETIPVKDWAWEREGRRERSEKRSDGLRGLGSWR